MTGIQPLLLPALDEKSATSCLNNIEMKMFFVPALAFSGVMVGCAPMATETSAPVVDPIFHIDQEWEVAWRAEPLTIRPNWTLPVWKEKFRLPARNMGRKEVAVYDFVQSSTETLDFFQRNDINTFVSFVYKPLQSSNSYAAASLLESRKSPFIQNETLRFRTCLVRSPKRIEVGESLRGAFFESGGSFNVDRTSIYIDESQPAIKLYLNSGMVDKSQNCKLTRLK
ncbi:hypothetical protein [Deinococcus multiflagellatus]|uniref:Lipoprotein n=1 Tax=Deinococcus multiflagellatus TaxID=1656887 RepID=A0ABW1ZKH2_9DEIO|nr:hypothetical protein [Deinococcus multiflagellatus]MBZ9714629.1 hypothetical protein [Deinococcus multiflagellatus]